MDRIKGTLYRVVEQIGIRFAYIQQRQWCITAELFKLPDKMRLVSVTALICQLSLICIFRIMLLQFQ